jgi:hypothetical protein
MEAALGTSVAALVVEGSAAVVLSVQLERKRHTLTIVVTVNRIAFRLDFILLSRKVRTRYLAAHPE